MFAVVLVVEEERVFICVCVGLVQHSVAILSGNQWQQAKKGIRNE